MIDLAHLLPPFARKRIYTFQRPGKDPAGGQTDCHWTAFNFFNDPPDDRFFDPEHIQATIASAYEPVTGSEWRMGDIVALFDSAGESIHSAVFIADDLVFTKNGAMGDQPWIYMRLGDMLAHYAISYPEDSPPTMVVFRRKGG